MAKQSKPSSKRSSKIENSGSAEAQIEELLHKLPNIEIDHVLEHKKLTQTFKKEDRVLHRLADLQRLSVDVDPQIMDYKPNPYNKSIYLHFFPKSTKYLFIVLSHGPLLLDRCVCLPLLAMWPSFGYFSTMI